MTTIQAFLPLAVLLSLLLIFLLLIFSRWMYRFSERTADRVLPALREVSLENLEDALHPLGEGHPMLSLPDKEFREAQKKRIRVALSYVERCSRNVAVLQQWGAGDRKHGQEISNLEIWLSSRELLRACIEFRICSVVFRAQLYGRLFRTTFLPVARAPFFADLQKASSFRIIGRSYERVRLAAADLGRFYGGQYRQEILDSL